MVWHKYEKYSENQPRNKSSFDRSDIPCLVKMSDGEIWSACWIFDYTDYHHRDFEGWRFRSMWGEDYIWEDEENDWAGRKVVAFAYMNEICQDVQ